VSIAQRLLESCKSKKVGLQVVRCHCGITLTEDEWDKAGDTDEERRGNVLAEAKMASLAGCGCQGNPSLTEHGGQRSLSVTCVSDPTTHDR
jgi:hypothetical protein